MPRGSVVAKNYSKALFKSAKNSNIIAEVEKDLKKFKENFSTNFAQELKNPVISKADLERIMSEINKKFKFCKLSSNFFTSLVLNRRLSIFPEIYEDFSRLMRIQQNILEVKMIFSSKPGEEYVEKVKTAIQKKYPDKKILTRQIIKEDILGGFQIKLGSELIDASLKNKLESIKKECMAAVN